MKKILAHLKNHKKIYGSVFAFVVFGAVIFSNWWFCTNTQFMRYCKEKDMCEYAADHLTKAEKQAFVEMTKYMKKTGKTKLDAGILKYADMEDVLNVGLKMRAASAEVARRAFLGKMLSRDKFSGNYDCMRQAYMNELSNEEVLFLQTPQASNIEVLKTNPQLRDMYILASSKLMKCMNEAVQKKYLEEINNLKK